MERHTDIPTVRNSVGWIQEKEYIEEEENILTIRKMYKNQDWDLLTKRKTYIYTKKKY